MSLWQIQSPKDKQTSGKERSLGNWKAVRREKTQTEHDTWIKLVSEFSVLIRTMPDLILKALGWHIRVYRLEVLQL